MPLKYIESNTWEKVKLRYQAFWDCEVADRCCLAVMAPREGANYRNFAKVDARTFWTDYDYILQRSLDFFENTFFGGEALPRIWVNLGPGILAAYLGSQVEFDYSTVWYSRFINNWDEDDYSFKPESEWWRLTKDLTSRLTEFAREDFFVSLTDLSGVADIMAHIRGTENLCMDLIDNPQGVIKARDYILDIWLKCYHELYALINRFQAGSTHWLNLWAPGKHAVLQCDFSTMISPAMFEEFFLPEIQRQCSIIEYPIYHLDGPEEVKHLDLLLDIPELKAIQWVPIPNQGQLERWLPMFKKIQAAGKGLYFELCPRYGTSWRDVEHALTELSPKGLFIQTQCDSEQEARWLLDRIDRWSCRMVY